MVQQLAFGLVLCLTFYVGWKRVSFIRRNILVGKGGRVMDKTGERLKNVLLVAFGQKKMFKRPTPAILHFFIYAGFLVINIEVLEFVIDGLAGTHRIFAPYLGGLYNVLMNVFEFLAFAVLLACVIMLIRRNLLRLRRFTSRDLDGWPRLDANIILVIEITLMCAILTMNATDQVLQSRTDEFVSTGPLFISSSLKTVFSSLSTESLLITERTAWWLHIIGILGFAVYLTYSKHLHIFLAFPNTYYASLDKKGHMNNMDVVTNEVKVMLGLSQPADASAPPGRFGAKDINDLSWTSLLGAYSCTECGRCSSECPANITGKKLSPRKIMMDTRDRMEDVGRSIDSRGAGLADGKSLLDHYITREEINACTSCNACVEACPVMINPLEIILELRRYVAMEESGSPASWNNMFQNIETNFAPWKFSPGDRFNWSNDLNK